MRTENQQHVPKKQRQYAYAPRPKMPETCADLKAILGDIYGNTYKGPYVQVTHKQAFEAREAKRLAKAVEYANNIDALEQSIDSIESLGTE